MVHNITDANVARSATRRARVSSFVRTNRSTLINTSLLLASIGVIVYDHNHQDKDQTDKD